MKKRVFTVLLAAILLYGCNEGATNEDTTDTASTVETETLKASQRKRNCMMICPTISISTARRSGYARLSMLHSMETWMLPNMMKTHQHLTKLYMTETEM